MNTNTKAHPEPSAFEFPYSSAGSFSTYPLDFDAYAEPRTLPAKWDLTELMNGRSRSNGHPSRQRDHIPAEGHLEG
jgi:hypothetical protein